jgi:hypothetical protein
MINRRRFLQDAAKTTLFAGTATHLQPLFAQQALPRSANDNVQLALIGAGIQGQGDTRIALQVAGVKLVAGRLLRRTP